MAADAKTFELTRRSTGRVPTLPFLYMKEAILGKTYALSLVIAGDAYTRKLNIQYRQKSYTPNVLAFPLQKKSGEIFLNIRQAKRECRLREESLPYFTARLFIHSLLHLKGHHHGSTMERQEQKFLTRFRIKNTFHP